MRNVHPPVADWDRLDHERDQVTLAGRGQVPEGVVTRSRLRSNARTFSCIASSSIIRRVSSSACLYSTRVRSPPAALILQPDQALLQPFLAAMGLIRGWGRETAVQLAAGLLDEGRWEAGGRDSGQDAPLWSSAGMFAIRQRRQR